MTDFPEEVGDETIKLAEERGKRIQLVDSRLADHDRQFLALNGSIDRLARSQEHTTEKLGEVVAEIRATKEIQEAVASVTREAIERQDNKTQFALRVAGGFIASLIVLLAALIGNHVL